MRDGTIIDGYARWELARRQDRARPPCVEHDLTTVEAEVERLRKEGAPTPRKRVRTRVSDGQLKTKTA